MRATRAGGMAVVLLAVAACWRSRVVQSTCPDEAPRRTAFDVTVARTAANEVHGLVVSSDSGKPIAAANVDYPTTGLPGVVTTADGAFTLRAESLGVYTLRVRRIGYTQALGRVRITADSGGALRLVMRRSTVVLDGCGYVQLQESRAWWQWWFPPPNS